MQTPGRGQPGQELGEQMPGSRGEREAILPRWTGRPQAHALWPGRRGDPGEPKGARGTLAGLPRLPPPADQQGADPHDRPDRQTHLILQMKDLLEPMHMRMDDCCPSFLTVPVFRSRMRPGERAGHRRQPPPPPGVGAGWEGYRGALCNPSAGKGPARGLLYGAPNVLRQETLGAMESAQF